MFQKSVAAAELPAVHLVDPMELANYYVEDVREQYRAENGEYCGRRSPEQKAIAESARTEGELLVNGALLGMLAFSGNTQLLDDADEYTYGNHTWSEFKDQFKRLMAGFAVITNRQKRDGFIDTSYSELPDDERYRVAWVLLNDFMAHNALRFGVKTAGLKRIKRVHDLDEGIVKEEYYDPDKATHDKTIQTNMANRSYTSSDSTHPAGKISPQDYIRLRSTYSWVEKDKFDYIIGFYSNAEERLSQLER